MAARKPRAKASSDSEILVRNVLLTRGWRCLYHNVRIGRVQVDLLMRDPSGILTILEVKAFSELAHLSSAQERRLGRVVEFLAQWEPVELRLVWIGDRKLRLLPVDGLTARGDVPNF